MIDDRKPWKSRVAYLIIAGAMAAIRSNVDEPVSLHGRIAGRNWIVKWRHKTQCLIEESQVFPGILFCAIVSTVTTAIVTTDIGYQSIPLRTYVAFATLDQRPVHTATDDVTCVGTQPNDCKRGEKLGRHNCTNKRDVCAFWKLCKICWHNRCKSNALD